jgi:molybdopterin molybdotransferase
MQKTLPLGLDEALQLTLRHIDPLNVEDVELLDGLHRALAMDIDAKVDSPSIDASLKDGYAVISGQVQGASKEHPVSLKLIGSLPAGATADFKVLPGTTVRILTGAKIPEGADAVVAEEFVTLAEAEEEITFLKGAEPGRNVLPKSSDVAIGRNVAHRGTVLTPGLIGLLAAAGHSRLPVVRSPSVAIIATGDEVVAPGQPLPEGKLFASNITTLGAWCRRFGMHTHLTVVRDQVQEIGNALSRYAKGADAIITSGGAWTGDRDLVAQILESLGWRQVFHRIRMGPGKAVGFGILQDKPVFILPGGPPSNLMGFLQIALPGLLKLAGHQRCGLPNIDVRLTSELSGRSADWTQFIYGTLERSADVPIFHALRNKSRLRSMAEAEAVVAIPEGTTVLAAGAVVTAQALV